MLLADDRSVLDLPLIRQATAPMPQRAGARAWTDDYSNILQVLSFGRAERRLSAVLLLRTQALSLLQSARAAARPRTNQRLVPTARAEDGETTNPSTISGPPMVCSPGSSLAWPEVGVRRHPRPARSPTASRATPRRRAPRS